MKGAVVERQPGPSEETADSGDFGDGERRNGPDEEP
jgi:hypothetical protein